MSQDYQLTLRPREAGAQFKEIWIEFDEGLARIMLKHLSEAYPDAYDIGIRVSIRAFIPFSSPPADAMEAERHPVTTKP